MASWTEQLASWLPVGDPDNPYPFEVLDCRAACAALTLAQADGAGSEAITAIEAAVRATASRLAPNDALTTSCLVSVATGDFVQPPRPAAPDQGHRWLLEMDEGSILARRRWTGQLVHVAEFEPGNGHIVINRLASERQFVYGSAEYAVAEIEFLLRTYLEGDAPAFPIPPGLNRNDTSRIALGGWKAHGPIARFARAL